MTRATSAMTPPPVSASPTAAAAPRTAARTSIRTRDRNPSSRVRSQRGTIPKGPSRSTALQPRRTPTSSDCRSAAETAGAVIQSSAASPKPRARPAQKRVASRGGGISRRWTMMGPRPASPIIEARPVTIMAMLSRPNASRPSRRASSTPTARWRSWVVTLPAADHAAPLTVARANGERGVRKGTRISLPRARADRCSGPRRPR